MAGITFTIPNVIATQPAGNLPAALLDQNWSAIQTALSGLVAALADLPLARQYTGTQEWGQGVALTAAATLMLGSDGNSFVVNGNTNISALSTLQAGALVELEFTGTPQLIHSANLQLQGAVNAQIANGDIYLFKSSGGGVWKELHRRLVTNADSTHFLAGDGVLRAPGGTAVYTLVATSDAEVTNTSAALQTMKTLAALAIPTTAIAELEFDIRKDATNDAIAVEIQVNGATALGARTMIQATAVAASGHVTVKIGPQATANYARAIYAVVGSSDGSGTQTETVLASTAGSLPLAMITSIVIRMKNTGGVATYGVANVKLYQKAGA